MEVLAACRDRIEQSEALVRAWSTRDPGIGQGGADLDPGRLRVLPQRWGDNGSRANQKYRANRNRNKHFDERLRRAKWGHW